MNDFYFLPSEYVKDEHGALGECISGVLYLIKESAASPDDLFCAEALFDRVFNGLGQGGESVDQWDIAKWKYRHTTEAGNLAGNFDDNDFLVWVDETSFFKPNWRVYKEAEFKKIFEMTCRNFAAEYPHHADAISKALSENGMNL
ncbi:hypothetical protein [Undibacterium sp. Ji49W]|uniref:hypothetical protein n=1 Tax=Undibacterium sp. Ji49W TaxID=3413040 RepID=UPI003BF41B93